MKHRQLVMCLTVLSLSLMGTMARGQVGKVQEVAPGVWFREGDLHGKGHCNNGWIEFEDYVVVIDANFPSGAEEVLPQIRKTTKKPVRFVLDTHHHGDHAYGNPVWVREQAIPVAHEGAIGEFKRYEPMRWQGDIKNRADVRKLKLDYPKLPTLLFPNRMIFDDGKRRLEFVHFGPAHTFGDACAYLPNEKILFTGDVCVNGPYNYMGDGDSESWIRYLEQLQQLDVETICPGHGPTEGKELLEHQKQYFIWLRQHVAQAIAEGKTLEQIEVRTLVMDALKVGRKGEEIRRLVPVPDHLKKFVGDFFPAQIEQVYKEMTGLIEPRRFLLSFGIKPGPSPTKETAGWTKPKKIVLGMFGERVKELQLVVGPDVQLVVPQNAEETLKEIADADAYIGRPNRKLIQAAKKLRWVQVGSAGVEDYIGIAGVEATPGIPELVNSDVVLTNAQRIYGPGIADHVMAFILCFTHGMKDTITAKRLIESGQAEGGRPFWQQIRPGKPHAALGGKKILVVGLGGIGSEVARRAYGFGMRVLATDPKDMPKPFFVEKLAKPNALHQLLPEADFVAICAPLTKQTFKMFGDKEFQAMKDGAYIVNIARGRIIDTEALMRALDSGKLAGAGLDVTDPEPLPDDHPLWKYENVLITPHHSGDDESGQRLFILVRENLRRFVNGEPLLNVVDKKAGY